MSGNTTPDSFLTGIGVPTSQAPSNAYNGNYAAMVGDTVTGGYFSQIQQTATINDNNVFFAFRVVLEDAGHTAGQNPHFRLTIFDNDTNTTLVNEFTTSDALLLAYPTAGHYTRGYFWTDWIVRSVDLQALGAVGHSLTFTLLASDCDPTGHLGYAVLDGFGGQRPQQGADDHVPEPATLAVFGLMAVGGGLYARRRRAVAVA